jgi:hypothetical protein
MLFSRRTPPDLTENPLTRVLRERTAPYVDLTISNPTRAGLSPSEEEIREALSAAGSSSYAPHPGMGMARERSRRTTGIAARIFRRAMLLTASTSEAYGFLFKLIGDPGDPSSFPSRALRCSTTSSGWRRSGSSVRAAPSPLDGHWRMDLRASSAGSTRAA